jgi:hypothetical protein
LKNTSRVYAAGLVVAVALVAMACNNGDDNNNSAPTPLPSFNNTVLSITRATDGSGDVYVGGDFTTYDGAQAIRIVRLNNNGTIDPGFATALGFTGSVRSIVLSGNQGANLYVGGDFTAYNGIQKNRIVRINANGVFDPAFSIGTGFDSTVQMIALAADGSGNLYVGGAFTDYNGVNVNGLVRLKPDGSVDPTFLIGTGFDNTVFFIVPLANGDLYVGGTFTTYKGLPANRLVRLHSDGTIDPTFVTGTGFDNTVLTLLLADDGSGDLYVGGAFTNYNGNAVNDLVRLNSNGVKDLSFTTGSGFNNTVFHVVPVGDGSGDLYVGGAFTSYNTLQANEMIRLNQNGTMDSSFSTGSGFDNTVFRIAPAGDGSNDVYAGGQFTQYQSTPIGRFVRLLSTGAFLR